MRHPDLHQSTLQHTGRSMRIAVRRSCTRFPAPPCSPTRSPRRAATHLP